MLVIHFIIAAALFQSPPITEIHRGGMSKMRFWRAAPATSAEESFLVAAAITTDMPITGDTLQVNVRAPEITKGKARLLVDGKEVKLKKVLWTGPTSFENVPVARTSCFSLGLAVNCTTRLDSVTRRQMGSVNEVSLLLKLEQLTLLTAAHEIVVEVNGKVYRFEDRHRALIIDLAAAFNQDK